MVKNCKQTEITSARLRLKLLALLVAGACWTGFLAHQVSAQETAGPWGEPVNLSLSAGTSDPALVVDSSGRAHAVWKDATLNYFVHSSRVNGAWRAAVAVELPFGTRRSYPDLTEDQRTPLHTPLLWAGRNNQIHAIWLDLNGRLQYSNVSSTAFEDIEAWAAPQLLAQSARGAVAITDGLGRLHVAYARQSTFEQSPSGLYYRGSTDGGETWSEPVMLYNSPYFRSLSADQVNIQLTATDSGALIAAWDNPFLERVYVAKSSNGGESWGSPIEIDSRGQDDGAAATGPSSIRIASAGDQIHVVWQAGHGGTECAVYHRLSLDGGETWQSRGRVISRDESCASSSHLVAGKGNTILLVSMADDQAYLTAWDGSQWGDTVTRDELARFINPLNFRDVRLGCIQIAEGASDTAGNRKSAIVLGCDTGPGDDIWAISLDLDALVEEIAPQATPAWQRPDVLSRNDGSAALQLLADADGWLHATWVQAISEDDPQQGLYYSRWDGIGWSQPKALLSSPGGRDIVQPAITLSPDSKMMAVWVDGMPGNAYFSQAALARAGNGAEWSSPASLPMAGEFASEPIIVAGQNGVIYVAYALPLNEGRGVYLVRSDDGGESWTGPLDVFDGAAAGWPMVGRPQLALGSEGTVHLMWAKSSLPPISEPLSLYYSRSTDGGARWTEPVPVAESPGAWSAILASGRSAVHRFWLAEDNDIWHQFSGDGGISWGQPQHVSSSGDATPVAASLLDGAGRPWLLRVAGTRAEQGQIRSPNEIRNWVMSDGRWTEEEVLKFSGDGIGGLAAAATSGGDLDVMFSAQGADQEGVTLYRSRRQLALPQVQSTVVPTLPPTPRPTATSTPTPAPTATALTSFPIDSSEVRGLPIPIDTSNPLTGPLLGIIPAGVMVLIALFLGIRRVRGGGRR